MLFNSLQFLYFFVIVTVLYFVLPQRLRWLLLLVASCYFYMAFVPAYILILAFTIVVDYCAGRLLEREDPKFKRIILLSSIVANVGVLALFKYYDFFNANLAGLAAAVHWNYSIKTLGLILPIGLSFHTFQAMSYTIEVYRGRQPAEHHFGIFALYVLFYPQLVAGPIERPQNLLHQFRERHTLDFDRISSGLQLMLWGLFQKAVIADRLAIIVNAVYADPRAHAGLPLLTATYLFSFQIYCDFAGYSNIALGAAEVMGFRLMKNFDHPYAATSMSDFWKRWHISLSSWFRDYLYIPLGGNRVGKWRWYFNLIVVFLVSGLWHGADWTFVAWGALHGAFLVGAIWTSGMRSGVKRLIHLDRSPVLERLLSALITFHLATFAWIFFRASSLRDALYISTHLFDNIVSDIVNSRVMSRIVVGMSQQEFSLALALIVVLETIQFVQRRRPLRASLSVQPFWIRWPAYYTAALAILFIGKFYQQQFIYFQF